MQRGSYVSRDFGKSDEITIVVQNAIDNHVSPEAAPVLANAESFPSKRPSRAAVSSARIGSPLARSSSV
jgi:hypothetical protein